MDLDAFELVLLRTPQNAPAYDEAELARIQAEHLAHHVRLRESGQVVTNGPVRDQPDTSLRGLTVYRTGSLERARQLAEADPAVRAGRLAIEIMTWYCPPGTIGTVVLIPGTTPVLGGGDTHAFATPGTDVVGVVLEYEV